MEQGKRNAPWVKRFLTKAEKHRGVLADRIKHYRPPGFACDFAKDVKAFGFKGSEMSEPLRNLRPRSPGIEVLRRLGEMVIGFVHNPRPILIDIIVTIGRPIDILSCGHCSVQARLSHTWIDWNGPSRLCRFVSVRGQFLRQYLKGVREMVRRR